MVIHRRMGRGRLQVDRRNSSLRLRRVPEKRTREGRAAEFAIFDASLPPEAARIRLPTISTASLSRSLLRLAVRTGAGTLQLLKGH